MSVGRLKHLLLCLGVLFPLAGEAQEAAEACLAPLRTGMLEAGVVYDPRTRSGIDVDLLDELTRRTGCRFEWVNAPRVRQWRDMEGGQLDIILSGVETPERLRFAVFYPYVQQRQKVMLRAGLSNMSLDAFLADDGLRMGMLRGASAGPDLDRLTNRLRLMPGRLVEAATAEQLVELLKLGQIDALISLAQQNRRWSDHEIRMIEADWLPDTPPVVASLTVSRLTLRPAVHQLLSAALQEMRRDGTLQRIGEKYLSPDRVREALVPLP